MLLLGDDGVQAGVWPGSIEHLSGAVVEEAVQVDHPAFALGERPFVHGEGGGSIE